MTKKRSFSSSWNDFVEIVTKKNRYLFYDVQLTDKKEKTFYDLFVLLGKLAEDLRLVRKFCEKSEFFRARIIQSECTCTQMGPPPGNKATAGRMNPAGISYFYLANGRETAIAETMDRPPRKLAVANFLSSKNLLLLDLTKIDEKITDALDDNEIKALNFLKYFADSISRPIERSGLEHIEYIPSQVACEYFSHKFELKDKRKIDGFVYPSAIHPGGQNVVLFPPKGEEESFDSLAECQGVEFLKLNTWNDFLSAIKLKGAISEGHCAE